MSTVVGPRTSVKETMAQIYGYLSGTLGIPDPGCAGAMGNMQTESSFVPGIIGGPAHGICQWQDSRFTALQNYASAHNGQWWQLNIQLGFMGQELHGGYRNVLNFLKNNKSPEACANYWNHGGGGGG